MSEVKGKILNYLSGEIEELMEREKEFSKGVIEALKLLTHDKKVPYNEYIIRLKDNPIAKKVKLADLKHNSDITRLNYLTPKDIIRNKKYKKAIKLLLE